MSMRSTPGLQPRYCIRFACLSFFVSVFTIGCSNLDPYRLPENNEPIATIEDNEPRLGSLNYWRVMSIDRKRIESSSRGVASSRLGESSKALGDPEDWIPIYAGTRKLEVEVCKYAPGVLDVLSWSGWHCGHTVLPLVAEPGAHYRLQGLVNKKGDFAEIWIEDAKTEQAVGEVVRVPIEG